MMQGLTGLGVGGTKASTGFGQWYTDMQDSKEVRRYEVRARGVWLWDIG